MTGRIRWGILGCGRIAGKFAEVLRHVQDAELVAVESRSKANADAFGGTWQAPRRYSSYEQLANDNLVDVVYVAAPHNLHAETSILCLNAGKHVLCEKPLLYQCFPVYCNH